MLPNQYVVVLENRLLPSVTERLMANLELNLNNNCVFLTTLQLVVQI